MSTEANTALVRGYIEELWNQDHLTAIDARTASSYTFGLAGVPAPLDRSQLKQFVTMFRTAFPDLHVTVEQLIGQGENVAARWHARGTQRGPLLGISPTDKEVTWSGVTLYRVADGTILEDWNSADFLGLLQQLGVVPPMSFTGV